MVVAPAVRAKSLVDSIMLYREDGKTIIKWSGNVSVLLFANILEEKGAKKDIIVAEAHTLHGRCWLIAPGTMQVMVWAVELQLATLPAKDANRIIEDVKNRYQVVAGKNVLATSLNNLNPVVHFVPRVVNADRIYSVGKDFHLY